jgi:hypothetical protein
MIQALHTQRRERSSDCSSKWVTTKSRKFLYVFNLYLNQPLNTFKRKRRKAPISLAIVAISGVLATKDMRGIDEWDKVCRSLGAKIVGRVFL